MSDLFIGVTTSSYQIEGKIGRGLSIWDLSMPSDIACDHYHRYIEDIQIMKNLGIKHYRFSISWPRLLPSGDKEIINQKGVDFYNNLINKLLEYNIIPYVTLYHWDLPLELHQRYGGWLSNDIISDFLNYAELCFELFGDRVKHWITFNEPWCISVLGYGSGVHAPFRRDRPGYEPYIVAHNILISHARTVKLFRSKYEGKIGISLNTPWWENLDNSYASEKALIFFFEWFSEPLFNGNYPQLMRHIVRNRLPEFTQEDSELLRGSVDFLGVNHYSTMYCCKSNFTNFILNIRDILSNKQILWDTISNSYHYFKDMNVISVDMPNMPHTDMGWIVNPIGVRKLLEYLNKYNCPIYITENGMSGENDEDRIDYLTNYIEQVKLSKADVKGYFIWTLLDNFEWDYGYSKKFGLVEINRETMERKLKPSAYWLSSHIN